MTILPSEKTVVLEPFVDETESGFYMPAGDEKNEPLKGRLVAIGVGDMPVDMQIGDIIFYEKWAGYKVAVTADKAYIFVRFDKVLGKLMPEKDTK